jgi:hypothetical protein
MRSGTRGKLLTTLQDSNERPKCDCGWLRPKFVDIRLEDKVTSVDLPSFYLLFNCPVCGAVWDAHYGKVQ